MLQLNYHHNWMEYSKTPSSTIFQYHKKQTATITCFNTPIILWRSSCRCIHVPGFISVVSWKQSKECSKLHKIHTAITIEINGWKNHVKILVTETSQAILINLLFWFRLGNTSVAISKEDASSGLRLLVIPPLVCLEIMVTLKAAFKRCSCFLVRLLLTD